MIKSIYKQKNLVINIKESLINFKLKNKTLQNILISEDLNSKYY